MLALIEDYVIIYRDDDETNKVALKLVDERVAIGQAEATRDLAYVEKLAAALPPRKVIRYLQVESNIRAIVRYELADRIPIIEQAFLQHLQTCRISLNLQRRSSSKFPIVATCA